MDHLWKQVNCSFDAYVPIWDPPEAISQVNDVLFPTSSIAAMTTSGLGLQTNPPSPASTASSPYPSNTADGTIQGDPADTANSGDPSASSNHPTGNAESSRIPQASPELEPTSGADPDGADPSATAGASVPDVNVIKAQGQFLLLVKEKTLSLSLQIKRHSRISRSL